MKKATNRLTGRVDMGLDDYNEICFVNPDDPEGMYNLDDIVRWGNYETKLAIAERICEYEDTGLTPEEITALKGKIERGELVEVVRCGECLYYHKAHVLCNNGTEKDISEFPKEALDFTGNFVTATYGINVGGKCELEKNCGYAEDKSVFRNTNDFCSRGRSVDNG